MSSKFRSLEGDEKVLYGLTLDDDPTSCTILLNLLNWVAIRKTRNIYICRRRVPLSKVCSSISENFHLAYTGGTGQSYVEVNANVQCSRGRRDYSPSRPHNLEVPFGLFPSEMAVAPRPQTHGLDTISMARPNGRSPYRSIFV